MIASNSAFSLLNCTIMADGSYHLVGDLDVVCYEGEHMGAYITGIVFVCLFPIGVPVQSMIVLKRAQCKGALYELEEDGKPKLDVLGDRVPAKAMAPIAAMYARYDSLVRRRKIAWCYAVDAKRAQYNRVCTACTSKTMPNPPRCRHLDAPAVGFQHCHNR